MYKAKVLLLGPCESGKTVIANFLSEATETSGNEYHPTQGCRILEFEVNNIAVKGKYVNAEVELWDCSGDHKFETCWPAIAKDANGVVFVFNPDQSNYDKDLESLYNYFVDQHGLRDTQCVIFAYSKSGKGGQPDTLPSCLKNVECVQTSLEDDGENLRDEFNRFLGTMLSAMSEKHEQDELGILNS